MSKVPLRFEAKAIFVPSGDQAGVMSSGARLVVRRTWLVPSGFITEMSHVLPMRVWKAIFRPSGENDGHCFEGTPKVIAPDCAPSLRMTAIWLLLVKAMRGPPGASTKFPAASLWPARSSVIWLLPPVTGFWWHSAHDCAL